MVLTKIEVNGVDVSSYLMSYEYERTFGDSIGELSIKFNRKISNVVTLSTGLQVEAWRGFVTSTDEKFFDGFIERFEIEGGTVAVTAPDKLWDLVRREVTTAYESSGATSGVISNIFLDLVTTYGGLNADAGTIQDSGTVYILQKFLCNHADIFERCKALADVLDWQFYYRADTDKVYFEPKGFTTNANTLTVGSNVLSVPKWQHDTTQMANDVTFVGAFQEIETTETGRIGTTSGYTNSSIAIAYEPISVKVYGDASNPPTTLRAGGVPGSTSSYYYWVDKSQKKIFPYTSFTTNHYFEIRYSAAVPIPINLYNRSSIDTYGRFKKTITLKDVRGVDDAELRGNNWLARYSTPFTMTTLKVKSSSTLSLGVGQKVRVLDAQSLPTVDSVLLINKHRIRYPGDSEEIDVGDSFWRLADFQANIMEKIKRQEETEFSNQDILAQVVNVNNTATSPIQVKPRYFKAITQTLSGTNVFVLGNPNYGVLGTNALGDAGFGVETNSRILQYENIYDEQFIDNDFKDAGNTTGTWNTATTNLELTVGTQGQSSSVDLNNGTITTVSYIVPMLSGGWADLYFSANGGANWKKAQQIIGSSSNPGTMAFTNTGTDLRWKIIGTIGSPITITSVYLYAYH